MKQHQLRTFNSFTLDNAMMQLKMHHTSYSSLLTHDTIPEDDEPCVSDNSQTKSSKKVHFGYVRSYKANYGQDPPGEHSSPSTCDCGYSPEVFCSVDEIAYQRQSKNLHNKDMRLLQVAEAKFTKKEKKARELPCRPLRSPKRSKPVEKEPEPAITHFLVVKAREDGSPDLWTRNAQCNQIKHNHSSYSTSALNLVYEGNNSKSNLSLPTRLQPADMMTGRKENDSKRKGVFFLFPGTVSLISIHEFFLVVPNFGIRSFMMRRME